MSTRSRRKSRHAAHRDLKPGLPPGTMIIDPEAPKSYLTVMAWGPDALLEQPLESAAAVRELLGQHAVVWVNVDGLGDGPALRTLAEIFGFHVLAMEDVVNVHQRTKVEEYQDYLFLVAHMVHGTSRYESEQLSMFIGRGYVVTFQEGRPGDCFQPVRERIRRSIGRIRRSGADYLGYALLDACVDAYFPLLDAYGERLHRIEESVLRRPVVEHIAEIRRVKWDLLELRRAALPLRDVCNTLMRETTGVVKEETRLFLRDCYDHSVRIVEEAETYREVDDSLMELYLSSVSNRMNEIMKVLTVISAVFIPLTFVVGVYGMNFRGEASPYNMPELEWAYGYPFVWGLMLVIALSMLFFFRRKGWLGRTDHADDQVIEGEELGGPR